MRLIDADALIEAYDRAHEGEPGKARQLILDAPTIEERKKGKWINHRNDEGHNIADCDQCGEAMQWYDPDPKPNYCPNCGAKMEG